MTAPLRLQLGDELFVALPAARARVVAYVLGVGAAQIAARDGAAGLPWLPPLLAVLRDVAAEHRSEPPSSAGGSADRTVAAPAAADAAPWTHDTVLIPEARRLTGWSPSYLCRLARRDGLGVKVGGVWHLDRRRLLARADAQVRRPAHT